MDRSTPLEEEADAGGDAEYLRRAAGFVYVDDLEVPQPSDEDLHHLFHVLRLRAGEVVIASDGAGSFVPCIIAAMLTPARGKHRNQPIDPDVLEVTGAVRTHAAEPSRTVAFAIPKGERAEWTVQKLTEIGINRIVPLVTDRSVVRLDESDATRRGERFRRIAREAGSQSRRLRLPIVEDPMTMAAFVLALDSPSSGVAIAEPGGGPVTETLDTILVGPEGGWSDGELAYVPVRVGLGSGVLRAETAALVAGTLLVASRSRLLR